MTRLINCIKGGEFGEECVTRVWPSFLLKRWLGQAVEVHATWGHELPEDIWSQFSDVYRVDKEESQEKTVIQFMKGRKHLIPKGLTREKMNWSWAKKDPRKYVCFIPHLSERWERSVPVAGGISLPFRDWLELKELVNHYGYEVIGVGHVKHTGLARVDRSKIGDETMFLEHLKQPERSRYLQRQLEVMSGAEFTLGMGGGGFLAPSFGLPAITVDRLWHRYVPKWLPLHEREDVSVLGWSDEQDKAPLQEKFERTRVFVREEIKRRLAP